MGKLKLALNISNNGLIIFDSLGADDLQTGRRLCTEITGYSAGIGRSGYCTRYETHNISAFHACMMATAQECKSGILKPILHFECHGDERKGLYFPSSNEYMPWDVLRDYISDLNRMTKNCCGVVMAACHGAAVTQQLLISSPSPFNILIAANVEMQAKSFDDNMSQFYRILAYNGDLQTAMASLPPEMEVTFAAEWFYKTFGSYLAHKHTQKEINDIVSKVLTARLQRNRNLSPAQRADALKRERRVIKGKVKGIEGLVSHFSDIFFHGQPPLTTSEVVDWIEANKASRNR